MSNEQYNEKQPEALLEQNLSKLLQHAKDMPRIDPEARQRIFEALRQRQQQKRAEAQRAKPHQKTSRRGALRFAAFVVGAVAASVLTGLFAHWIQPTPVEQKSEQYTAKDSTARFTLQDGSTLILQRGTQLTEDAPKRLTVQSGAALLDTRPGEAVIVKTPQGKVSVAGGRFALEILPEETRVVVLRGELLLEGSESLTLRTGEVASLSLGGKPLRQPSERASFLASWARQELSERPALQDTPDLLLARLPNNQSVQYPLPLRDFTVDVYLEDQVARVAVDQTFFNYTWDQLEGVYTFVLPHDAALSRVAMYVEGKLMEAGIVERQEARKIYESIVYQRRDPALVEWLSGNLFQTRIFPLFPRQEKRILLSYTQELPRLFDGYQLLIPIPKRVAPASHVRYQVTIKDGANLSISSGSHSIEVKTKDKDAIVSFEAENYVLAQDLLLNIRGLPAKTRLAQYSGKEGKFLSLGVTPKLPKESTFTNRQWVLLHDASGSRNGLERRAQDFVIERLLQELDPNDTFEILSFNEEITAYQKSLQRVADADLSHLKRYLYAQKSMGFTDLESALKEAQRLLSGEEHPYIIYIGDGSLGPNTQTQLTKLQELAKKGIPIVALAVGNDFDASVLEPLASVSGGLFTKINIEEDISWRIFDLIATLNTSRLTQVEAELHNAKGERIEDALVYLSSRQLGAGEELSLAAKLTEQRPAKVVLKGLLDGKSWSEEITLPTEREEGAKYLPRLWAQRRIAALLQEGPTKHQEEITRLGLESFLVTPFTSLLVLENDEMYKQYNVNRGSKDDWARYKSPEEITVTTEEPVTRRASSYTLTVDKAKKKSALHITTEPVGAFITLNRAGYDPNTIIEDLADAPFQSGLRPNGGAGTGPWGETRNGKQPPDIFLGRSLFLMNGLQQKWSYNGELNNNGLLDLGNNQIAPNDEDELLGDRPGFATTTRHERDLAQWFTFRPEAELAGALNRAASAQDSTGLLGVLDPSQGAPLFWELRDSLRGDFDGDSLREFRGHGFGAGWMIAGDVGVQGQLTATTTAIPPAHWDNWGGRVSGAYSGAPSLFLFMPGLQVSAFDLNKEALFGAKGFISESARAFLQEARARLTPLVLTNEEGAVLSLNQAGQFTIDQTLPSSLKEQIFYDGQSLYHFYQELGLSTKREVGDAEALLFLELAPFVIPDPEKLSKLFVVARKDNTITLRDPETKALVVELVFDGAYRITAIRIGAQELGVSYQEESITLQSGAKTQTLRRSEGDDFEIEIRELDWSLFEVPAREPSHWLTRFEQAKTKEEKAHLYRQLALSHWYAGDYTQRDEALNKLRELGDFRMGDLAFTSEYGWVGASEDVVFRYLLASQTNDTKALREISGQYPGTLLGMLSSFGWATAQAKSYELNEQKIQEILQEVWLVLQEYPRSPLRYDLIKTFDDTFGGRTPEQTAGLWDFLAQDPTWEKTARQLAITSLGRCYLFTRCLKEAGERIETLVEEALSRGEVPPLDGSLEAILARSSEVPDGLPDRSNQRLWALWKERALGEPSPVLLLGYLQQAPSFDAKELTELTLHIHNNWLQEEGTLAQFALVLAGRGEYQAALTLIEPKINADSPRLLLLGAILSEKGSQYGKAALYFSQWLSVRRDFLPLGATQEAYLKLYRLYKQVALTTRSEEDIEQALWAANQVRSEDDALDLEISDWLFTLGKTKEARRYLHSIIDRSPGDPASYQKVGGELEKHNERQEALQIWIWASQVEPTNPLWLLNQGYALNALGREKEAQERFQEIVKGQWHDRFRTFVNQAQSALSPK